MRVKCLGILAGMALLSSCMNYDFSGQTITQGNLLPEAKFAKLKVGMSKQEVALLMGASLTSPLFQTKRWDYVQTTQPANKPIEVKTVTLVFEGQRLSKINRRASKTS